MQKRFALIRKNYSSVLTTKQQDAGNVATHEMPVMLYVMQCGYEGTIGIAVHSLFASAVE